MPSNFELSTGLLYAFLLVLARIGGAFVLIPIPGMQAGTELPRIVASVAITVSLFPSWPHFESFPQSILVLLVALLVEAATGLSVGVAVSCLIEMLQMAGQITSQHAGFGFASLIDPNTNADSGLLVLIAKMMGSLLFLALGVDREVLRILAESLASSPPGLLVTTAHHADTHLAEMLFHYAGDIFTVGLRLSLPSIALLGLIDLSLALLSRINSQLHITSLAFPVKMLAAMLLLSVMAGMYPRMIRAEAGTMIQLTRRAAGQHVHAR